MFIVYWVSSGYRSLAVQLNNGLVAIEKVQHLDCDCLLELVVVANCPLDATHSTLADPVGQNGTAGFLALCDQVIAGGHRKASGDEGALAKLTPEVYAERRRIAGQRLSAGSPGGHSNPASHRPPDKNLDRILRQFPFSSLETEVSMFRTFTMSRMAAPAAVLKKLSLVLVVGLILGGSLPSAHGQRLLFYNSGDRSAAVGHIESGGLITDHQYGADRLGNWTNIAGDGLGHLLFYNSADRSGALGHFSESSGLVTDHIYAAGSFATWTHIAGDGFGHLLFYNFGNRSAAVGHIEGTGFVIDHNYGAGSLGAWTHIAGDGFHFLFYNFGDRSGAVGHINESTGLVTDHIYAADSFGAWTHVVGDGLGHLLFYDSGNGAGADGHIESIGLITDHEYAPGVFGTWTHIAGDGFHLLFYNSGNGAGADGHIESIGLITDHEYAPGLFGNWTRVAGRI